VYQNPNGRNLTVDADYGMYRLKSDNFQPNVFYDSTGTTKLSERNYFMITPTEIDIYSLKSDYEQNLGKGKLGLGFKSTYIKSDNDFQSYNHTPSKIDYDSVMSNTFRYRENINAVYATYNQSFKGFQVMFGLRLEQTLSEGTSTGFKKNSNNLFDPYKESFDRNLLNLFPSMVFTLNKNPKNQWTFSYSRRINRPSYQDMNPFEKRASEYGGFKGNPDLRPEFAHSFSVINVFKSKLVTSLSFTHTDNVIVSISDTFNGTKSFYFPKNLASQQNLNLNTNFSYSKNAFSFNTGMTAFYVHNTANFGPGRVVDIKVFSFTTFIQPNIKTGRGWSFMSRAWYNSPQIFRGTMKMRYQVGVNMGVQKLLFDEKATLRINYNDVFNTVRFYGTSDFAGQYLIARAYWEPRRLVVSMSFRFGSSQVKSARQRRSGIDDENSRTRDSQ
jgi:iron complex outermembrane receptor protein